MTTNARVINDETYLSTTDGARLATDVTVADDGARHPVLLVRTPYGRASARAGFDPPGLARLGWAVVVQDCRGRWDSPGSFTPFAYERSDGAFTVRWCAEQPWSDGSVAMAGASYVGMTQWLAAAEHPPGLRAIAPTVTAADLRDGCTFEGGALRLGVFAGWALEIGALGSHLEPETVREAIDELDRWPEAARARLDRTVVERISPAGTAWFDHGNEEFWGPLNTFPAMADMDLAGYHVAGWHDIFCDANLAAYEGMTAPQRPDRVRRRQRLVVGPWAHTSVLHRTTGQLDFGTAADGQLHALIDEQVRFLTAAVTGPADAELPGGAHIFVMGRNRWHDFASWPPPTTPTAYHLASGGRLTASPTPEAGADRVRHDPADPVPTLGGRTLHPGLPEAGPIDQRELETRDDMLVYTSDPLADELTIVGAVRARVMFESTATPADLTAKLVDVHPDGRAMLVVDSVRRVGSTPGRAAEVEVDLGSTALTFGAGHRIRVELASSNFPKYDLCHPAAGTSVQTIHHGGRTGSAIVLPVWAG